MATTIDKVQLKTRESGSVNDHSGLDFREIAFDENNATGDVIIVKNTSGNIVEFYSKNYLDSTNGASGIKTSDNFTVQEELNGRFKLTGFISWGGTGNYYSVLGTDLTLLRDVTGVIDGETVVGLAGQSASFIVGEATFFGIDSTGTLISTTSPNDLWFRSNISLFQVIADGTNHLVVENNHKAGSMQGDTNDWTRRIMRSVIGLYNGEVNDIGGNITRVTSGTGGVVTDRELKIVGNASLYDVDIYTPITDTSGVAISQYFAYVGATGKWTAYLNQAEIPMVYNNAGTITAIPANNYAINSIYVTKSDPNTGGPTYICVIGTNVYINVGLAQAAINSGAVPKVTNELAELEPALLGHVIIHNATGGYIHTVIVSKQVAGAAGLGGGVGSTAALTSTTTTNFNKLLSSADVTVQLALDTLDEHVHTATTISNTAVGNLSSTNVQASLEELQGDINNVNTTLAGLTTAVVLKGTWDASSGSFPGAGATVAGWSYIVSVAGTMDGIVFNIGDRLLSIVDSASITTYANNWLKLDYTDQVSSVFSRVGAVVATSGDYAASQITNTPAGSIASTDVQNAINELDGDATTHYGDSTIHFLDSSVTHNNRSDLQGGTTAQYYHLTSSEYTDYQMKVLLNDYNEVLTTTYTFALADMNVQQRFNNASPIAVTIPLNSSVAFPIGAVIPFKQIGVGQVTVNGDVGVTVNYETGNKTLQQYSSGYAEKVDTDTWELVGSLTI